MKSLKTAGEKRKAETIRKLLEAFNGEPKTWSELEKVFKKATLSITLRELIKKQIIIPTVKVNEDGSCEIVYLPPNFISLELSKPLCYIRKIKEENGKVYSEPVEVVGGEKHLCPPAQKL